MSGQGEQSSNRTKAEGLIRPDDERGGAYGARSLFPSTQLPK